MRHLCLTTSLYPGLLTTAQAEDLKFSGGRNWLTLASDKDINVAIGIARSEQRELASVSVVRAANGYYAVLGGYYDVNTIAKFKSSKAGTTIPTLPKDAYFSNGARYVETVWLPSDGKVYFESYSLKSNVQIESGSLSAFVSAEHLGTENAYTKIEGSDTKSNFHFDIGKDVPVTELQSAKAMSSDNFFRAGAVRLIAGSESPQLVLTAFSGGAHCCTETFIAGREPNSETWSLIHLSARDGLGFGFEDVAGTGVQELVSVDNAFLYAFNSYAGSMAPIKIYKWRDGKIEDASFEPEMRGRLVQDLAGMEWQAKLQPDLLKANGYLAGWVAAKIRLGQGDEAWNTFISNYDKKSDFGPQSCTSGQKINDCPAENLNLIPIPKALARFLRDNGYGPLPKAAVAELE